MFSMMKSLSKAGHHANELLPVAKMPRLISLTDV